MKFQSQIERGGSILTPHNLELTNDSVIYSKRNKYLIGNKTICLKYKQISSVTVHSQIIGTDIVIVGFGGEQIHAKNFSITDAKKIYDFIQKEKKD